MATNLFFDIETDGAERMWTLRPSEFFRLGGCSVNGGPVRLHSSYQRFRDIVQGADRVIGHNIISFDLPALLGRDVDILGMARAGKIIDTWALAPLVDQAPWTYENRDGKRMLIAGSPERMKRFYSLDNLAFRYGAPGKVEDLRALAKEFGGFGSIPIDDPRYREYLEGDVQATMGVALALLSRLNDYAWREMRVQAFAAQTTINGFRLDEALARAVVESNTARNQRTLAELAERYDIPLTDAKGRPRKSPLATKPGKAALLKAFADLGLPEDCLPRTDKGAPSFSGDGLKEAAAKYAGPEAQELARAVAEIGGTRTVFQTALNNVHGDGFCHPEVTRLQRTGRWSVQDPGLTVFGKHNGRHRERAIFLPDDEDHVLFAVDLAQMDARAVAAHAQDPAYLDLFLPGVDSHMEVAKAVWGAETVASDPKPYRNRAKALGHGNNYGMGAPKLADSARVPLEVAVEFQAAQARTFPRLQVWKDEVRAFAEQHGWVDNGFGRRVAVDPERAYTQAPAAVGQAATTDVLMSGALRLPDDVARMCKAVVHDEMVFSVHRKDAEEVRNIVVKSLGGEWAPPGADRPVTVLAESSPFASRWSGCYE